MEDIHSRGHLTDEDMKVINKYMLNQMTGLILSMQKGEWLILEQMSQFYLMFGNQWDNADLTHYNREKENIKKNKRAIFDRTRFSRTLRNIKQ